MKCSLCGESYRCEGCQRYDTYVDDEVEESIIDRLRSQNAAMLEALENLENDDGKMPESAWNLILSAIAKAKGAQHGSENI